MEDSTSITGFGVFLFVAILILVTIINYFIFKAIREKSKSMQSNSSQNNSHDFSAFETSPDKFTSTLDKDLEPGETKDDEIEDENVIKGDLSRLEEFIDKLKSQPKDTIDDIQISKSKEGDLLIAIVIDEEEGFFLEAYYPEEEKEIPRSEWFSAMKQVTQEFNLESEDMVEEKTVFITLEGKSTKDCKAIIERILTDGYLNKLGNTFYVEYIA